MTLQDRILANIPAQGIKPAQLYAALKDESPEAIDSVLAGLLLQARVERSLGVLTPGANKSAPALEPEEEARIVAGRALVPDASTLGAAHIPVQYEQACRAIMACTTIDEAKYWSDKADALAAWAKIYRDDRVSVEAKRLKLHSYRRIAELADQIMPEWRAERGFRTASVPIILKDQGFGETQARVIAKIGELPRQVVQRAIDKRKPPTPSTLALVDSKDHPTWERIKRTLSSLNSMTSRIDPETLAKELPASERKRAGELCDEISGWCYMLNDAVDGIKAEEAAANAKKAAGSKV